MQSALSMVYANSIQETDEIELANAYSTGEFELIHESVSSVIAEDDEVSSEYVSAMLIDRLTMLESELLAESILDDVEYDLNETAQLLVNNKIKMIGSIPNLSIVEAESLIYSPIADDSFILEGLSASAAAAKKAMLLRHSVNDAASAAAKLHKSQSKLIKSVKHIKANIAQQQGALAKAKTAKAKAMIEKGIATAQKKLVAQQTALKAATGKAVTASKASAVAVKTASGKIAVGSKVAGKAVVGSKAVAGKAVVGLKAAAGKVAVGSKAAVAGLKTAAVAKVAATTTAAAAAVKSQAGLSSSAKAHAVQKALIGDVKKLKLTLAKDKAAMAASKDAKLKAVMKKAVAKTQSKLAAKQASLKVATSKAVSASKASAAAAKASGTAAKGAGTAKGAGIAGKAASIAAKGALMAKAGLATAAVAVTSSIGAFALSAAFVGAVAGLGAVVAKRKLEMVIAEKTMLAFGKKYKVGGIDAAKSEAEKADAKIKADTNMDSKSKAKAAIGVYGKFLADGGGAAIRLIAQETRKEQPGFKSDGVETLLKHRAQTPGLKTMKATLRQFTSARKTIVLVLNKGNSQAASYFISQLNKSAKI